MKRILTALMLLSGCLTAFTACEETEVTDPEYADWQARNAAWFATRMNEARNAIAQARADYGDDWEAHCAWRMYRNYARSPEPEVAVAATDSICVEILESGTGTARPLYTDSVRVNYIGRLMPTDRYPDGYVFDHSGLSENPADVFSNSLGAPTKLAVSGTVEGFTTALQMMRVGDRWRIYIPQELGYGDSPVGSVPAYSATSFEVQLKGIYPVGTSVPGWY